MEDIASIYEIPFMQPNFMQVPYASPTPRTLVAAALRLLVGRSTSLEPGCVEDTIVLCHLIQYSIVYMIYYSMV